MKSIRSLALLSSLCLVAAATQSGCGSKKKTSEASVNVSSDPNSVLNPETGQLVSSEPHPAACAENIPPEPGVSTVAGCAATVGTLAPSEGVCFVQNQVAPSWGNEPPSSGPQYEVPEFNYYMSPTVVPRGRYVRSLAHGYVVISYNCPLGCAADVAALNQLITGPLTGLPTILTEDPLLKTGTRFAAMSWNYAYPFETIDSAALSCFVRQHNSWGLLNHVNGGEEQAKASLPDARAAEDARDTE